MLSKQIIVEKLFKLAQKAFKKGEVPVAAIVIHNNRIIACQYNKREQKKSIIAHAEILAIQKASRKLKRWNLSDCDLYVTLKPCSMCTEVLRQSRINNVYYLTDKLDYKHEFSKTNFQKLKEKEMDETYQHLLSSFFKNKR